MQRIQKTVFISYRRTDLPWAQLVNDDLTRNGYDVFFDIPGLRSGDFEGAILEEIQSRDHFLVLLTPSALERCKDPRERIIQLSTPEVSLMDKIGCLPLYPATYDW